MAGAVDIALPSRGVAQSDAAQQLAACALDRYDQRADAAQNVSADGERHRRDDEGTEPLGEALRGSAADGHAFRGRIFEMQRLAGMYDAKDRVRRDRGFAEALQDQL